MGGGQETFDRNNQWTEVSDDLTHVQFYFHFPGESNFWLFDRNEVYRSVCKKTSKYLNGYGIKNTDIGPVEGGGGGLETIWEIMQKLWENKDVIEFALSLLGYMKSVWKSGQIKMETVLQPRLFIGFIIEATSPADLLKDDLDFLLQRNLANLLTISRGVVNKLSNDFDGFLFDFSIEARVPSLDYSLSFTIPNEKRTEGNMRRFFNVIASVVARKNISTSYTFTKWFSIKRQDEKVVHTNDSYDRHTVGTYYFFISSTILRDKFKLFR